ncbi:MAG: hypothetical protein JWN13_5956 [Betaproteobacteria bacterium]|jgi:hypothetical protein|nr:hypothetical protein [Betaproteobacteria bacterium]
MKCTENVMVRTQPELTVVAGVGRVAERIAAVPLLERKLPAVPDRAGRVNAQSRHGKAALWEEMRTSQGNRHVE